MRLVMTLMVRDEADIIAAMLEHHLAQGVDLIMVTDNGSVDGTREILARYEATGRVELADDPVHRKQQHAVVSAMARRAFIDHEADWVLNADADEFFLPVDRSMTLAEAFRRIPKEIGAFSAPVTNLVGPPARAGSGLRRLTWRDERSDERLEREAGVHAQPTPNAVHVGDPRVELSQGNHYSSIESAGEPPEGLAIEVLHLPWRSWAQFARKVEHAGLGYAANPDLVPSPRHHGLRDYRFLQAGVLEELFLYRFPEPAVLGTDSDYTPDAGLPDTLERILADGSAVAPDLLEAALADSEPDYTPEDLARARQVGAIALALDRIRTDEILLERKRYDDRVIERNERIDELFAHIAAQDEQRRQIEHGLDARVGHAVLGPARWLRGLFRR